MKSKLLVLVLAFSLVSISSFAETSKSFDAFFKDFYPEFVKDDFVYSKFVNPALGFYYVSQPGIAPALSKCDSVERGEFYYNPSINADINYEIPEGDKCEGYPGSPDGFYVRVIEKDQLPNGVVDFDDEGGFIWGSITIPTSITNYELYEVSIISDEGLNKVLYFIFTGNKWCLLAEDVTECSA